MPTPPPARAVFAEGVRRRVLFDYAPAMNIAVFRGRADEVAQLLAKNADPNEVYGTSVPLYMAALRGHVDVGQVLVASGADVNALKRAGGGSVSHEERSCLGEAIAMNHPAFAMFLLAQPNIRVATVANQKPFLNLAARRQMLGVAARLLELGVDVNESCYDGTSALFWAASNGSGDLVQLLLTSGADVNRANGFAGAPPAGWHRHAVMLHGTALMAAARHGRAPVVQTLLAAGANINQAKQAAGTPFTSNSSTALSIAVRMQKTDVVTALLAAGARVDGRALHEAAWNGNVALIAQLLESGASLESTIQTQSMASNDPAPDYTPLIVAVRRRHVDAVRALIQAGANVDRLTSDKHTALYYAALLRSASMCRLLIESGADAMLGVRSARAEWPAGVDSILRDLREGGAGAKAKAGGGSEGAFNDVC